ncbi:MAG: GGDEF domain-containing response regulator [Planctomycetes bacterium]|nr:GGDEF domain-containing response regulator [Planctomycetota bacterium]
MATPLRVLIVEDSEDDAVLVVRHLERAGYAPAHARVQTAADMIAALEAGPWDCVIADYSMPHFSGTDALAIVRSRGMDLPFIIVSGTIGEEVAVAAMKAGAHDYVMKGNLSRLGPALARELRDAADRRERRRVEEERARDLLYDAVTGLPNRTLLLDRLGLAIERAGAPGNLPAALLFVGLGRFHAIVEAWGHRCGDAVLEAVARRLEGNVRAGDTVGRVGETEFAVVLDPVREPGEPARIAEALERALSSPVAAGGQEVSVTPSVGIAPVPGSDRQAGEILRDANTAMHRAMARRTAGGAIFESAMHDRAVARVRLENDLRRALERGELEAGYQPVVSLRDRSLTGFECLARWKHPERGLIGPAEFIPIAEDTGQILPIGAWVLREACMQVRDWGFRRKVVPVAVNLSALQFAQADLADRIRATLVETGADPRSLHLEITESVAMDDAAATIRTLASLKALGVKLKIDDFGTGYSSLSYLHRFPLDALKIDQSFVRRIDTDAEAVEIVRTIVALAHAMSLTVVAEGVETEAHFSGLKALGCDEGQGFLFGGALDARKAEEMLK